MNIIIQLSWWLFVSLIPFCASGVAVQKESSNKYFNHIAKQFEVNVEGYIYKISLLSMSNQKVECWLQSEVKQQKSPVVYLTNSGSYILKKVSF